MPFKFHNLISMVPIMGMFCSLFLESSLFSVHISFINCKYFCVVFHFCRAACNEPDIVLMYVDALCICPGNNLDIYAWISK